MNNFLTRAVCFIVKGGFSSTRVLCIFSNTDLCSYFFGGFYITLIKSQLGEKTVLNILKSSQELHKNVTSTSHKKKEATTNVIKESVGTSKLQ